MKLSATIQDLKDGRIISVNLPIAPERIIARAKRDSWSDEDFAFIESTFNLIEEHTSLKVANRFAEMVEDVDDDLVKAVSDVTGYKASDFVDYDFNFSDCYLLPDVTTRRELGEYWVDELGIQNIPRDQLEMYFDYEAYGRDIDIENQGGFSEFGWVDIR